MPTSKADLVKWTIQGRRSFASKMLPTLVPVIIVHRPTYKRIVLVLPPQESGTGPACVAGQIGCPPRQPMRLQPSSREQRCFHSSYGEDDDDAPRCLPSCRVPRYHRWHRQLHSASHGRIRQY
jgi:hypothetical protein